MAIPDEDVDSLRTAEEEFQLSLKKALVQKNPWLPSSNDSSDPFASEPHTSHELNGCPYRQFKNYTVYSKPAFVHEYLRYVTCAGKRDESDVDAWVRRKVFVGKGARGDLRLNTDFEYTTNIDPKRRTTAACADAVQNMTGVLYLVFSAPGSFDKRDAVRRTWANDLSEGEAV